MRYIIDRFENEFAVVELENGQTTDIPKIALPPEAVVGSVIEVTVTVEETSARRSEMKKKMQSLFRSE